MRTAAEVLPGHLSPASHVVVDGDVAVADLDRRALRSVRLMTQQLALVRLVRELSECLLAGDLAALERLAFPLDALHVLLDLFEILRREGVSTSKS